MRQYTAILLLFLSCNLFTELHEIYFFPALLSHYQAHTKKNQHISWIDFLQMHYTNPSEPGEEEHPDMPFKHNKLHEIGFAVYFSYFKTTFNFINNKILSVEANLKHTIFYQPFVGKLLPTSIWHPPCCR